MIKYENSVLDIEGTGLELTTELTCVTRGVIHAIRESGMPEELVKGLINLSVELAFKPIDEVRDMALDIVSKKIDGRGLDELSADELEMRKREMELQAMMSKLFK